ncbi:MAG: chloride channel protein [Telmatospirillum sp.]|nr:chloride channel protein [Telmatospirillum sp.]
MPPADISLKGRLRRLFSAGGNLAFRRGLRGSQTVVILLCACLGAAVGGMVDLLHLLVSWLHIVDFGLPEGSYLSSGRNIDPVLMLAVPALGGLALSLLPLLDRRSRQRDIVDPIEANALYGGRMSFTDSLRLVAATLISNGAGASLGMEAAYTQIGAGLLSSAGQWLRLRRADLRVFVAAGAAAAIAAAYNAPLAGAFYAYELVLGSYSPGALAQVATAALTGTLVMRAANGAEPVFLVHQPVGGLHPWDYALFALVGVGAAVVGIATMRAATGVEKLFSRLKIPSWLRPVLGGGALSLMALAVPQVLGSGHGGIQALFDGDRLLPPLLLILAAKLAGSAVSIGAGFRGGLFSSSLFLGCLFGACLVQAGSLFTPWLADNQGMFLLVGMGAVAASIVGAPVTMVLLVLEMTGDYEVALGVLAGVITSATITRYSFGYSFATWRFHQRGKLIRGAHDVGWLSTLTAGRMMRADARTAPAATPLLRLRAMVPLGSRSYVYAVDDTGAYAGLIEMAQAHDPDIDDAAEGLVAGDLAHGRGNFLLPDMDIRAMLQHFEEAEAEALPVLAGPEDRRVIGYVSEAYVLRRYSQELERQHSEQLALGSLFERDAGK